MLIETKGRARRNAVPNSSARTFREGGPLAVEGWYCQQFEITQQPRELLVDNYVLQPTFVISVYFFANYPHYYQIYIQGAHNGKK